MNNDEITVRRLLDLAHRADQRGIVTYSDFLSNNELQIYFNDKKQFNFVDVTMYGGFPEAERQVLAFSPKITWGGEPDYPIACLYITPAHKKFAEDLTHRDYLGAILNLGIERTMLGDILVTDNAAYLFCKDSIASFILKECIRIRHTTVRIEQIKCNEISYVQQYEEISGTVSSLRLDSILTICTRLSRGKCTDLIHAEKVFCNHKLILSPHYTPADGEIISIRGIGKFVFCREETKVTKKGRNFIKLLKYK